MTRNTDRNYIKPVFALITFVMMIFTCLIRAIIASKGLCMRHFSVSYFSSYCCRSNLFNSISFVCLTAHTKTFFAFAVTICYLTAFLCFMILAHVFSLIFSIALLAYRLSFQFTLGSVMKFRQGFGLLAKGTSLGYDTLSHFCLLIRRLWLGPDAAHTAVGSIYSNMSGGFVHEN